MIVLDTHALIWWVSADSMLSDSARAVIEAEQNNGPDTILISSISAWEVAMLVEKGRLSLSMDVDSWLSWIDAIDAIRFVPVENAVAVASTRLPGEFHKDPADRIIVALARSCSAPLVTADEKIRQYAHVKTIW